MRHRLAAKAAAKYDPVKEQEARKLMPAVKWISSMSVHPGGDNLIIGSYDKKLCWFDLDLSSSPYKTMRAHEMAVRSVCYHPRLPLFASGSDDATLRVWDPITGDQKGIVEGVHTKRISDVQLSWDMTFLVTSCSDMWVRLFETSSLQLLKAFNTERNINSAAISPLPSCPYLIAAGGQDAMSVTTTPTNKIA